MAMVVVDTTAAASTRTSGASRFLGPKVGGQLALFCWIHQMNEMSCDGGCAMMIAV